MVPPPIWTRQGLRMTFATVARKHGRLALLAVVLFAVAGTVTTASYWQVFWRSPLSSPQIHRCCLALGERTKIAVLSDGRAVFYGREMEIVNGRFRIVRIGADSIDLSFVNGRSTQTITFSGQ